MTEQIDRLLAAIQRRARAIHAETGLYVTYSEGRHAGGALTISVSIEQAHGFEFFRGSEKPLDGHETTLEAMNDALAAWQDKLRRDAA